MKHGFFVALAATAALSAACAKNVDPGDSTVHVTGVNTDVETVSLYEGETYPVKVTVVPSNATDTTYIWESLNDKIAYVADNVIYAVSEGFVIVSVVTNDGHKSADVQVKVIKTIPEASIAVNPSSLTLKAGTVSEALDVVFYPDNATDRRIVWSSDDESVASVDADGVVTGVKDGSAVITATSKHGCTSTCNVTVTKVNLPWVDGYPQGVTVNKFNDDIGGGMTCEGAWVEVDFDKNPALRFNVLYGKAKTLIGVDESDKVDWYDEFPRDKYGIPVIITNAGFFWYNEWNKAYETSSAVVVGNIMAAGASSTGISGWPGTYYPVRSAFMQTVDGEFSINWIYPVNNTQIYTYPDALGQSDKDGVFLKTPPTAATPGATRWENGKFLIQGGPRLVQNGRNVAWENTWAELLNGTVTNRSKGDDYRTARTAIGLTSEGHLIMLVCRGDGRNGVKNPAGYNMGELADKMIEIGCVDAVNFDGGGSSAMVGPDGKHLVVPLESGKKQRAMPTAISLSETQYE